MAIYHLNVSTGSKGGGQSAAAKDDYIEREEKYEKGKEEIAYIEHGNMPEFAVNNPREYWQAADQYERSNARLFRQVEFALPVELSLEEQIALAHEFAEHLTGKESMPYTLAIHKGEYDHQGKKTDTPKNPHVHLIISERANDGIARTAETWFKRANKKQPEKGGAAKSKSMESKEWLKQTREDWANMANAALSRAGIAEKIDHRTLEAQGITDRLPQVHRGTAGHMADKGILTDRLHHITERKTANRRLKAAHSELEKIDKLIQETAASILREKAEKPQSRTTEQAPPPRPENQAERQDMAQVRQLLATHSETELRMKCEILERGVQDIESYLRHYQRNSEKLAELNQQQREQHAAAKQAVADLSGGFLGKLRNKKEIEHNQMIMRKLEAENRKVMEEIRELPQKIEAAEQQKTALNRDLSVFSAALIAKQGIEIENALKTQPEAIKRLWKDREAAIRSRPSFERQTAVSQHRQLQAAFRECLKNPQRAMQKRHDISR